MPMPPTKPAAREGMLQKLFSSPPPMMNGESADVYAALLAEVKEQVQPKDILDQIMVRDVTDHVWEQMRYRRSMGVVINAHFRQALLQILIEGVGSSTKTVRDLADFYFDVDRRDLGISESNVVSGFASRKSSNDVVELLNKHNFDESSIEQLAVQIAADTLKKIDDMAFRHEFRREQICREIERRRKEGRSCLESSSNYLPGKEARAMLKQHKRNPGSGSRKS
jgi:hypothetical protein